MERSTKGALLVLGAIAVPATINAIIAARTQPAQQSLPGDIAYYDWVFGRVAYYRLGQGPPLLLVHHPGAGASAWEWRKVFPEFANTYTVYAIDLLGFGASDKPDVPYSGALFADLLNDFAQDVIGARTAAVGSGLGASYLVNLAVRRPESVERLALANPTGVTSKVPAAMEGMVRAAMRVPIVGESVYYLLESMRAIEEELTQHVYVDPTLASPEMVRFLHNASHQPGSAHAATAYVSGRLDLPMRMAFASLTQPVLLLWGDQAYYTPVRDASDLLYRYPAAKLQVLSECGMLPHDEKAGEFIRDVLAFFREEGQELKVA